MYSVAAPHIRRVIVLGMAAGPRIGPSELFRLAWADVELAAGYMRMPNAAKGAKEDSRIVPIRDDILPLLREWREEDEKRACPWALADECSCEVVQAVHDQLCELVEEHRERKEAEPLTLSKGAVKCVLKSCGVSDSHVEEFALRYDDAFGADMALSPRNLVEKQIEVCTPDVVIKVSPERSDLVDTRVIDGVKYILIRADEGVEVNGVPVHIAE